MEIRRVGVVGIGQMGAGIVEVCARAGYEVVAREVNETLLAAGLDRITVSLDRAVARGRLTDETKRDISACIRGTTALADLADVDLVIEAVPEHKALKAELFAALDAACAPQTLLATNTSSLSVTALAAATQRQDRVLGIHFFNPAPVMPLVEIVQTLLTSAETVSTARAFVASLGKTAVLSPDVPGFIVNRLLIPYLLDAARLLQDGIASREDIDAAVKLGLNHPMGPLALMDLIGLDTCLAIAESIYDEYRETRFAPPPLLRRMVLAGRLGRKVGRGFYDYPTGPG